MLSLEINSGSFDFTHGYEPCGDEEIDFKIPAAIRDYAALTVNGERADLKRMNVKERLNHICWKMGESSDPNVRSQSTDLKALLVLRGIAKVMLSGDPRRVKDRHIPLNDYWLEVEEKFYKELRGFTARQGGELYPIHLDYSKDSDNVLQPMAMVRDFTLYGSFLIRGGMHIHTHYLAAHSSLSIDEALQQVVPDD